MDLAEHFRVIAHNWWRILLVAVLVGGGVYYLTGQRADVYETNALLSVTTGQRGDAVVSREETVFLTQTYVARATTRPVVHAAIRGASLDIDVGTGQERLSAATEGDLGFLTLNATGPTPRAASRLANSAADALIEDVDTQQQRLLDADLAQVNAEIAQLQSELDALSADAPERGALQVRYESLLQAAVERRTQPRDRLEVVSDAAVPSAPSSPRPLRDGTLAFLLALVVAAELSVALQAAGDRLPSRIDPEAIGRNLGLPVLATIPRGSVNDPAIAEAFRVLRTNLFVLPADERPRSITVASSGAGAGKSFTSINLAESIAAQQSGVLLADADLRRPAVHERLEIDRVPGLSDVLQGASVRGVLHSVGLNPIYSVGEPRRMLVLSSGRAVPDPVTVLGNNAVRRLIDMLDDPPSLIVIDTPPSSLFADASVVASQTDATVFVVDTRNSRRSDVRNAIVSLQRGGANLIGIVLNRTVAPRQGRYYAR